MNDDTQAVREIEAVSNDNILHTVLHYLYVPNSQAASKVEDELKQRGFRTEKRLGADGVNWLVLARHEVVPSDELMIAMRRSMEAIIGRIGGEYDGWEAYVGRNE